MEELESLFVETVCQPRELRAVWTAAAGTAQGHGAWLCQEALTGGQHRVEDLAHGVPIIIEDGREFIISVLLKIRVEIALHVVVAVWRIADDGCHAFFGEFSKHVTAVGAV